MSGGYQHPAPPNVMDYSRLPSTSYGQVAYLGNPVGRGRGPSDRPTNGRVSPSVIGRSGVIIKKEPMDPGYGDVESELVYVCVASFIPRHEGRKETSDTHTLSPCI